MIKVFLAQLVINARYFLVLCVFDCIGGGSGGGGADLPTTKETEQSSARLT